MSADNARICAVVDGSGKRYCGRRNPKAAADWRDVTCQDCLAARRADQEAEVRP